MLAYSFFLVVVLICFDDRMGLRLIGLASRFRAKSSSSVASEYSLILVMSSLDMRLFARCARFASFPFVAPAFALSRVCDVLISIWEESSVPDFRRYCSFGINSTFLSADLSTDGRLRSGRYCTDR
jgi:hypothetical protein